MSVLYRAIWNDGRDDLLDAAAAGFRSWVAAKAGSDTGLPETGDARVSIRPSGRRAEPPYQADVRLERAASEDGSVIGAVRARLDEFRGDGSHWTTTLRAWRSVSSEDEELRDGAQWLWVDVEAVADTDLDGVVVGAPRLVCDLIQSGADVHRRCVPLSMAAAAYEGSDGAERLADLLGHADRDLPIVVFRPGDGSDLPGPFWAEAIQRTVRQTAGLAAVATIDDRANEALAKILGDSYALHSSGLRIYLPGLDPATERDEWRHRELHSNRFNRMPMTAARLVSRRLAFRATSRRAPRSYDDARDLLERERGRDTEELWQMLDLAEQESRQQRDRLALADDRYIDLLADHEAIQAEAADLRARFADQVRLRERLLGVLRRNDLEVDYWTAESSVVQQPGPPARASSPSDAAALAQAYLSDRLDLPAAALKDLDELDATVEAPAWGQTAWDGFRALHAYAEDLAVGENSGSFWTWCESSGNPLVWRATSKKLAMAESETVRNNRRLRMKRVLPVSTDVDPNKKTFMEAHLKIAEGGGPRAPRIYFLYSADTGKIHVGFFGPHRHMPNSLT
jgi:hypothetical protein